MRLVIITDQGEVIEGIDRIDTWDFSGGLARADLLNTIHRAVLTARPGFCDGCGSGLNTIIEYSDGWFCQDCADRMELK